MREQPAAWSSAAMNVTLALACAAVGMVGLPLAFGGSVSVGLSTWGWLVGGVVVSVLGLVLVASVSTALAAAIGPRITRADSSLTPTQSRMLARLLLFGLTLIVVQATLRRPLALLLGGPGSSSSVEAAIAAAALAIVLGLLVWSYQTARPIVQGLTLQAIDAAIPTVNAPLPAEPTRTTSVIAQVPDLQATLRADKGEPTVRLARSDPDATIRTAPVEPDATIRTAAVDATIRTAPVDPDVTIRAGENP